MAKEKPRYNVVQNIEYMMRHYLRESKSAVAAALLQAPVKVSATFLAILLPSVVLRHLADGGVSGALIRATAGVAALVALATVLDKLLDGFLFGRVIYMRVAFMAEMMYKNLDADYAVIEQPRTRELQERANKFTCDNRAGGEQMLRSLRDILANMMGLALYSVFMARLNAWVFAGLFALSAINYAAVYLYNRYDANQREARGKIWNRELYLRGKCADFEAGKDVRIYNIADWFERHAEKNAGDDDDLGKKREGRRFASEAVGTATMLLRDGWAYVYLLGRVLAGGMGVSEFVLYFGIIAGYSAWINGIALELTKLNRCSLECNDYRAFLELPDRQNRGAGIPLPSPSELPSEFAFKDVRYTYPGAEKPAIDIEDLTVSKGQKLAIVGRNGAGKTTFVKLLTGIYMPDAGLIAVNGQDAQAFNRDEYYDLFTAVFQDFMFLPGSIAENVALKKKEEIDLARVADCLSAAGLREKVASLPYGMDTHMVKEVSDEAVEFSGGEKQRLILARALYKNAPVLVLDEPTAALDPIAESDMYQKYASFAKNRTSVFISHRLASTRFCDRILFIEDGKIVEDGTHDELMKRGGKYQEMFDIQSHYYREGRCDE
jgi:ABC-type multidrug transport system fused ATPase/permease subunit